ncbi:ADAMTS-like protein 4, partial [Biomphalaria pfeifferi]
RCMPWGLFSWTTLVLILYQMLLVLADTDYVQPWQEWTSWSVCSSSCGQGISTRTRQCTSNKYSGSNTRCTGKSSEYKVCVSQVCSSDHVSSRETACSLNDQKKFSGRQYSWEPFTHPTDPCKLSCRAKGVLFLLNLPGRAEDGTPCNTGMSRAVCFQGTCQPVGCDDLINSSAVKDKCGVCNGDDSSCTTISSIFTSSQLQRGFNDFLTIPAGSTNINITELQPSRNVLIVQASGGQTIIDGDSNSHDTKDLQAAGTYFNYLAKSSANFRESLTSPGPTNITLLIKLNVRDLNPAIYYTFNVPNVLADDVLGQITHRTRPDAIPTVIKYRPQPVELSADSQAGSPRSSPLETAHGVPDLPRRLSLAFGDTPGGTVQELPQVTGGTTTDSVTNDIRDTTTEDGNNSSTTVAPMTDLQNVTGTRQNETEDSLLEYDHGPPGTDNESHSDLEVSTVPGRRNGVNPNVNSDNETTYHLSNSTDQADQSVNIGPGLMNVSSENVNNLNTNATIHDHVTQDVAPNHGTLTEDVTREDLLHTTITTTLSSKVSSSSDQEEFKRTESVTMETQGIETLETTADNNESNETSKNTSTVTKINGGEHSEPKYSQNVSFSSKFPPEEHEIRIRIHHQKSSKDSRLDGSRADVLTNGQTSSEPVPVIRVKQVKRKHNGPRSREIFDSRRGSRVRHIQGDERDIRRQTDRQRAERQRQLQERQRQLELRRRQVQEQEELYNQKLREYNERLKQRRSEIERRPNPNRKHQHRDVHKSNHQGTQRNFHHNSEKLSTQNNHLNSRGFPHSPDPTGNEAISSFSMSSEASLRQQFDNKRPSYNGDKINRSNRVVPNGDSRREKSSFGDRDRHNSKDIDQDGQGNTDRGTSNPPWSEQEDRYRHKEGGKDVIRIKVRPPPINTKFVKTTPKSALSGNDLSLERARDIQTSNQIPSSHYIPSSSEIISNNILPNQILLESDSSRHAAYEWRISGLTDCTHTCGGGAQKTVIVCVEIMSQAVVTDDNCRHVIKPEVVTLPCNKRPCPAVWTPGLWTQCSKACGQGEQTRILTCMARVSPTLNLTMSSDSCEQQVKPPTSQPCNVQPCTTWHVSNWTQCSSGCGDGQRTRQVECMDRDNNTLADDLCTDLKPVSEERCNLEECGKGWYYSEWLDECKATCGTGEITRHVYCGDDAGNPVSDQRCDLIKRPATHKSCRANKPCGGAWFVGPWSTCDAVCGPGQKQREVLCIKAFPGGVSAVVTEENCDNSTRPVSTEACQGPTCVPQWYMTAWTECSQSCGTGHRTREVKCLSGDHKPNDKCQLESRPRVRDHCNSQECLNSVVTTPLNSTESQEAKCEDQSDHCAVVKRARLCRYGYYQTMCCRSCADEL